MLKTFLKKLEKLRLPTISNGVLDDTVSGNEFEYSAIGSIDVEKLKDISNATMLKFNQGSYTLTSQACTIVNSIRNLMKVANGYYGYISRTQDVFDAVEYAKTMIPPYVVGYWWYVWLGVDAARKRWNNKYPEMKMVSYKIDKSDGDFAKLMFKGYPMTGSYNGSIEYNSDFRDNAVLDWAKFGKRAYGHCTIWRWMDNKVKVDDSYTGNFYNIYHIKQPKEIVDNNVRSNNFYFFAPEVSKDNTAEIKRLTSFKAETQKAIEANSNAYNITTEETYQKFLNTTNDTLRNKISDIDNLLKAL